LPDKLESPYYVRQTGPTQRGTTVDEDAENRDAKGKELR